MRRQTWSKLRGRAARKKAFSLANASSIGLKSGLSGGRNRTSAHLLDRGPHLRLLVDREVVEDDDIARAQRRDQDLFDVGEERRIVNGPIEHRRRAHPVQTEYGDHRVRLPVPARGVIVESGAARAPAVAP